jgi:hypothetical protein
MKSIGGAQYYMSFTDNWSRETRMYFMANKSNVFEKYQTYENWVNMHCDARIKFLHTNHGGEYLSNEYKEHLQAHGTE